MDTIIAVSGSLRAGSFNTSLARAAAGFAPDGCTIELASIREIPLYDGDVEAQGMPRAVEALKDRIAQAMGVLLVTPEYNNSVPGVLKNAIDWCTRPPKDMARVFAGIPFGIIGATPGPGGTRLSQTAWLPIVRQVNAKPFFAKAVYLASAKDAFDDKGSLVDAKLRDVVQKYVEGFVEFARANRRR
jgi:chromate reductase, NAD(P)H dehydrogenase (quinone)